MSYKLVITEQAMDTLQELDLQLAERILRNYPHPICSGFELWNTN